MTKKELIAALANVNDDAVVLFGTKEIQFFGDVYKRQLVFKWNESEIKTVDVLSVIPFKPLFGHTTGRQSKTIWMYFCPLM